MARELEAACTLWAHLALVYKHVEEQELDYQASRSSAPAPEAGRPITILADRELPYELLKKIMSTCVDAGYASISLAVNQRTEQGA